MFEQGIVDQNPIDTDAGTVVTYKNEVEFTEGGKTIRLVRAYQYLCPG